MRKLWDFIRGWFGSTIDDLTGGTLTRVEDAIETAEDARDFAEDPMGGVAEMTEDLADDVTGGAISDARYAHGVAADPLGTVEGIADAATGGLAGDAIDAAEAVREIDPRD